MSTLIVYLIYILMFANPNLIYDVNLSVDAQDKADRMAQDHSLVHDRMVQDYEVIGVGRNFQTVPQAVASVATGLLESDEHRVIIEDSQYIGCGITVTEQVWVACRLR